MANHRDRFPAQRSVLLYLMAVESASMDKAAAATGLSHATVRAAAKGLVKRGFAFERLTADSDVRGVYVITDAGRRDPNKFMHEDPDTQRRNTIF